MITVILLTLTSAVLLVYGYWKLMNTLARVWSPDKRYSLPPELWSKGYVYMDLDGNIVGDFPEIPISYDKYIE